MRPIGWWWRPQAIKSRAFRNSRVIWTWRSFRYIRTNTATPRSCRTARYCWSAPAIRARRSPWTWRKPTRSSLPVATSGTFLSTLRASWAEIAGSHGHQRPVPSHADDAHADGRRFRGKMHGHGMPLIRTRPGQVGACRGPPDWQDHRRQCGKPCLRTAPKLRPPL